MSPGATGEQKFGDSLSTPIDLEMGSVSVDSIQRIIHLTHFRPLRSLSEKSISLCLCEDSLCLCGEITPENIHHRGTEIAQRHGEPIFPTDSSAGSADKRPEFRQMGFVITRDESDADIVLELRHDLLTKYVFSVVDVRTQTLFAGGKLSSVGGTVADKVAKRFVKEMMRTNSP